MKIDQLTNGLAVKDKMLSDINKQKEHLSDECEAKVNSVF